MASPRARGSTWDQPVVTGARIGFPARAGIDPGRGRGSAEGYWLPRARGDRPGHKTDNLRMLWASPRARGSTPIRPRTATCSRGFPARAGIDPEPPMRSQEYRGLPRARGDRPASPSPSPSPSPASPRARGSTLWADMRLCEIRGFPARAGIDPRRQEHELVEVPALFGRRGRTEPNGSWIARNGEVRVPKGSATPADSGGEKRG